jgi:hypothetical protein
MPQIPDIPGTTIDRYVLYMSTIVAFRFFLEQHLKVLKPWMKFVAT